MLNYKLLLLVFAINILTSCIKDPCANVFCGSKGECISGICACEALYVGESCNNSFASYFSGSFLVNSNCLDSAYNATVSAIPLDSIKIFILSKRFNFYYDGYFNAHIYHDQDAFFKFKIQDTIIVTTFTAADTIITGLDTIINDANTVTINYFVDGTGIELNHSSDSLKFELNYTLTEKDTTLVRRDIYSRKL